MRTESDTGGQATRGTFIEAARRAQIVAAAIETIAAVGYGEASLARIAEQAGISKGVIGYHFAGKDDLLREVVAEVLARAEEYMVPLISAHSAEDGFVRAYVESNLAFMGAYRDHVIAIVEIARGARQADGSPSWGPRPLDTGAAALAQRLAQLQDGGELRPGFDPRVMAGAIRAAIDAVPRQLAADRGLDIDHQGRELADLFDLATRIEPTTR